MQIDQKKKVSLRVKSADSDLAVIENNKSSAGSFYSDNGGKASKEANSPAELISRGKILIHQQSTEEGLNLNIRDFPGDGKAPRDSS